MKPDKRVELLTLPVGVRVLIIIGVVAGGGHTQRMEPEIGDFEHETTVHHAVARLEVSVRADFRRMNVGHRLDRRTQHQQREQMKVESISQWKTRETIKYKQAF